jgi:indolepyruvate ferredoxin oxidoreductase beta subunit
VKPGKVTEGQRAGTGGRIDGARFAAGVVDDIMVVGVGGQGVIVAAAIIADTAMLHGGLQVKTSETRGMSQRGGSVSSHIRIGETVVAPSISPGEIDYLLAFEAAEGLRRAPSVSPDGLAIVNTKQIVPPLASTGTHAYPFDAIRRMVDQGLRVVAVDGDAVAGEIGDAKVAGVVLVGALSGHLPFAGETWDRAIARNVPASWLELNLAAFAAGRRAGASEAGGGDGAAAEAASGAAEAGAAAEAAGHENGGRQR